MNREIKFRGIAIDNGGMVYGYLIKKRNNVFAEWMIEDENGLGSDVVPNTIGQYTGLLDKNDLEIYEGDVIKWLGLLWIVDYNICGARFTIDCTTLNTFDTLEWYKDFEKVGNRHENPELLEVANEN